MNVAQNSRISLQEYENGVLRGDRVILSKAITLVESALESDRIIAEDLIEKLLPKSGKSIRIGITGVPGVGKSTFIESFGMHLTSLHKKVAILVIDPSSQKTKGSILGDKTRMDELSKDVLAFIRPSSSGSSLGGVTDKTREAILLCEAAGFEIVIVETVGVGQSEVSVRGMVDFFLLLMLGGAGDELQGIKKGIMEMADGVVITKADGDNLKKAKQAMADYQHALHLFQAPVSGWLPKVLISSATEKKGIKETWEMILDFDKKIRSTGFFAAQRKSQNYDWFYSSIENKLKQALMNSQSLTAKMKALEADVVSGKMTPGKASGELVRDFIQLTSGR